MDAPNPATFSAASSSTLISNKETPPFEQFSQRPFIFHEVPCGELRVREMARQQWEILKPLIQRIYIEENKPFSFLAKVLRNEHGFEPT